MIYRSLVRITAEETVSDLHRFPFFGAETAPTPFAIFTFVFRQALPAQVLMQNTWFKYTKRRAIVNLFSYIKSPFFL